MLTDHRVPLFGLLLFCIFVLRRIQQAKRAWQAFGNLPAYSIVVSPIAPLNRLLPRIPRFSDGTGFSWRDVYERFFAAPKSDIVQLRSLFPYDTPHLMLADATATKAIFQSRTAFTKVARMTKAAQTTGYGPNLSSSDHDEWRKHRRIAGPSFSESNNHLVWEAAIEIILGYFIKWNRQGKGSLVKTPDFTEVTTQIAFMVFATAGFGMNVDWDWDKSEIPKGHTMPFMQALSAAVEGIFLRMALPDWLISLTKRGRHILCGHEEMEKYMLEMIEGRKGSAVWEEKRDLMSNLIGASMEKNIHGKDFDFTQRDLLGNIFVFLFAGHETTASALSFAIALLATHQEEQEELYKHVRSVVPDGRLPTYQDVPQLTRVLAVINETLRLFPPGTVIMKEAAEDCVIPTESGGSLPVPKGTTLLLMINAMHHNPKYWPDPYEFRPSRFLGDYNKDAFIPFSAGARVCIGRRFSEIEQIAVLSVIVLHYRITVLEEPEYAHETAEERKRRVLAARAPLVVKPVRTPVMFTPREGANISAY